MVSLLTMNALQTPSVLPGASPYTHRTVGRVRLSSVMFVFFCAFTLFMLPTGVVTHESDICSISELASWSNFSTVLRYFKYSRHRTSHQQHPSKGALVRLYSTTNTSAAYNRWHCQLQSHQQYCDKHGYVCYFVTDTERWAQDRKNIPTKSQYWIKLQVLRELLPQHPWVLYLDTDSVFLSPSTTPSVESIIGMYPESARAAVFVPQKVGWTTDIMFFRNSVYANAFLEHVWNLRMACPSSPGEQGAFQVAMLDAMVWNIINNRSVHEYGDYNDVKRDKAKNCCVPRKHCHYPRAFANETADSPSLWRKSNKFASYSVQGCVWNWQVGFSVHGFWHLISNV
jgi:hypothetical protein